MASQLATTLYTDFIPAGWPRMAINVPLIGATTFHLFTTYPVEPDWIVRHRRIQLVPYGLAAALVLVTFCEPMLALPPGSGLTTSMCFTFVLFIASFAIMGRERRRHLDGLMRDRADLMSLAATVSFLPIILIFMAEWVFKTPFPYYVRRQLFEIRLVAKSSATYGAATLAITGVFAFLITFADAAVRQLNVSFRWFEVTFLFLAILAFNPLRNRLQDLVDRFFDRDREAYRVAVRWVSSTPW
jgi:hypothetical protein